MKFTLSFFLLGLCAAVPLRQARQADATFNTIPDRLALRHATGTAGHPTPSASPTSTTLSTPPSGTGGPLPPSGTGGPVPPSGHGGSRPPYPTDGPTPSRGTAPPIPYPTGSGHHAPGSLPY
ncbi:hypothetical protein F5Y18DRAFT_6025 [Xylariaceae sp. FL1019]|nr:hypothetical protein F5Y18DRAFT_6025 [Xylariaceae sp. FL1019]